MRKWKLAFLFAIGLLLSASSVFACFDPNGDGVIDSADIFYLTNYIYNGGPAPIGDGDANGDGVVDVADVDYLISFLFENGPAPVDSCNGDPGGGPDLQN
jgi:hypothetical protein